MEDQEYWVQKALRATKDLCECVKEMDLKHRNEALIGCLEVILTEMD